MEIGIVGLPNVGKSTLFNALTSGHAASSNYPFTTIEPNVGVVSVPDSRLQTLTGIFSSKKTVPAYVKFVDIAGLVRGASQGEGLGNKFLSHIREVDAIAHMVRLFADPDVVHTLGGVDPLRDAEIINTELILSDLQSVERQAEKYRGPAKSGDKAAQRRLEILDKARVGLEAGQPARSLGIAEEDLKAFALLSAKPVLYIGNCDEAPSPEAARPLEEMAATEKAGCVTLCGKLEHEIIQLSETDRPQFLKEMGLEQTGLERVIVAATRLLRLLHFFTAGPTETHAWTIVEGMRAPQAAGRIHSDFEKGFIRADIYSFKDIEKHRSEPALREKGLIRSEGKDYVVRDGDVCFFKFNV
ncbi:MAG: redox-regulated ATPase YchF [Elusimicrobia bacterium]|nr:redox-regulated ATPase YchF [Elusimicrobiota bacterium]